MRCKITARVARLLSFADAHALRRRPCKRGEPQGERHGTPSARHVSTSRAWQPRAARQAAARQRNVCTEVLVFLDSTAAAIARRHASASSIIQRLFSPYRHSIAMLGMPQASIGMPQASTRFGRESLARRIWEHLADRDEHERTLVRRRAPEVALHCPGDQEPAKVVSLLALEAAESPHHEALWPAPQRQRRATDPARARGSPPRVARFRHTLRGWIFYDGNKSGDS